MVLLKTHTFSLNVILLKHNYFHWFIPFCAALLWWTLGDSIYLSNMLGSQIRTTSNYKQVLGIYLHNITQRYSVRLAKAYIPHVICYYSWIIYWHHIHSGPLMDENMMSCPEAKCAVASRTET